MTLGSDSSSQWSLVVITYLLPLSFVFKSKGVVGMHSVMPFHPGPVVYDVIIIEAYENFCLFFFLCFDCISANMLCTANLGATFLFYLSTSGTMFQFSIYCKIWTLSYSVLVLVCFTFWIVIRLFSSAKCSFGKHLFLGF